jgi:hypothetical protein
MNFQLLQSHGIGGEIAVNNREDQEIAILALHLLQICIVYINTLLEQKMFTPLFSHINISPLLKLWQVYWGLVLGIN